ncbi:hypothetical protein MMC30_005284 [Trapelia coarctata]|nr:hypothetical protein [Trapelia coarctata]
MATLNPGHHLAFGIARPEPPKPIMTASQFPKFSDGDLIVYTARGGGYQLHANVFRRSSPLFSKLLADEKGAALAPKAKKEGVTVRYRLDLVGVESGNAKLVPRAVDQMGRSSAPSSLPDSDNGRVPSDVYRHYDNLFRAFYNEALELDAQNLATALHDCMGLLEVAEKHRCVSAIQESVDIVLLRQGQVLFKSISQNPAAWANFACRVKSPTIFKESLIHLVGKWKMGEDEGGLLHPDIAKVCERKHKEFQLLKEGIELRILGHYSVSVQKKDSKDPNENPGRMQYANDIYPWMALAVFRHWFAQNVAQKNNYEASDGGYAFYYMMSKGGQAYLDRDQCLRFHLYCPMSQKGKTVFENHMSAYKAEIQTFVEPLMINRTQLEPKEAETLAHLLCLEVEAADYPWNHQTASDAAVADDMEMEDAE